MNIGTGSRRSEQEDGKNGFQGKFYKEEREQVWSAMKEVVPRVSVEYNIVRLEEVYLNPQIQYPAIGNGCSVQLIS